MFSKRKWDEGDFESDMDEDFDEDMAEEGLPTGHDAVAPGKGILLLPHRQLHPHSQVLKVRPSIEQEPRVAIMPPHAPHHHLGAQDHGEWTYEEQFRQVRPPFSFVLKQKNSLQLRTPSVQRVCP